MLHDIRHAIRALRGSPGFSLVAALSLALGIGANTAVFSLVHSVLLRMLPVQNPEQLVQISVRSKNGGAGEAFSYPGYERFRDRNQTLAGIFAFEPIGGLKVGTGAQTGSASGVLVSGSFFEVLGVRPAMGRLLTPDDDRVPDSHPVAVISDRFWQRRFGSDPSAIGSALRLNGFPFTIVGVTEPAFFGVTPDSVPDLWVPMMMQPRFDSPVLSKSSTWWLSIIGRLKPGVSREQAQSDCDLIYRSSIYTRAVAEGERIELTAASRGLAHLRARFSRPLVVLMAAVGIVLLISCANLANLLLARSFARRKEMAVRTALGANRWRLARQVLTESLLLTAMGCGVGCMLAWLGRARLLEFFGAGGTTLALGARLDLAVLIFAACVSILTGLLFGLAPALRSATADALGSLKNLPAGAGPSRPVLKNGLMVAQLALTVPLLAGAGLFASTLRNFERLDIGVARRNLLMATIDLQAGGYSSAGNFDELLAQVKAIPGVRSASLSSVRPFGHGVQAGRTEIVGGARRGAPRDSESNAVSPAYFETAQIPLLRGRLFTEQDSEQAPRVAVINATMARLFFDGDPLGRSLRFGTSRPPMEVVGIVADGRYHSLRERGMPMVYYPIRQQGSSGARVHLSVRTAVPVRPLVGFVRKAIGEVYPNAPALEAITLEEQIARSLSQERLLFTLSGLFAVLALVLAVTGLYGVVAYGVTRRTHEIGVRMALGARAADVLRMVLRETARLAAVGLATGVVLTLWLGQFVRSLLFGLTPNDTATLVVAALVLTAAAMFAAVFPAIRASRIQPVTALRVE